MHCLSQIQEPSPIGHVCTSINPWNDVHGFVLVGSLEQKELIMLVSCRFSKLALLSRCNTIHNVSIIFLSFFQGGGQAS